MFQGVFGRCQMAAWTTILAAATVPTFGQEGMKPQPFNIEAAAHQLANEILDATPAKQRLPLTSDTEHARSIDPVMTEDTAIWIHEALPSPPLTVLGGSVFSYSDMTYDPLDAPVLKIRPIDDDQVVPFLIRVFITPVGEIPKKAAVTVSFPAPPIFDPRVGHIEAWVASKATEVSIESSLKDARLYIRVPLTDHETDPVQDLDQAIPVIVAGELVLGPYRPVSANRLSDLGEASFEPSLAGLATLEIGRDVATAVERERLETIAQNLGPRSPPAYDQVVVVNSWVSSHLQYRESRATRSAVGALEDRSGDCDEHTILLLALLRATGIPARPATGLLYNFDALGAHTWVEVGLPKRDGAVHWFIVDPTLAGTSPLEDEKAAYVQFKDRIHLYPMKPLIYLQGMTGQRRTDVLLNWRKTKAGRFTDPSQTHKFIDFVKSSVERHITGRATGLVDAGLLFRRESASIVGSPYLLIDRPLSNNAPNRIQFRLENEERLVLDLTAGEGSEIDDEAINSLRAVYRDLSHSFFAGNPAYHNLELVYLRDRHSDRLHTVSLRVGRYLLEHQLTRILKRLSKAGFLTAEETARIEAVAEASGGKNLYLLQELARQLATGGSS